MQKNDDIPEISYHDFPRNHEELVAIIQNNMLRAVEKEREKSGEMVGRVWRRYESNMLSPNYGQWGEWQTGPANQAGCIQYAKIYAPRPRGAPEENDGVSEGLMSTSTPLRPRG